MNKNENRMSQANKKGPSVSNLIQLKLIESTHKTSKKFKIDDYNLKANSIINTPSTIDLKKFHSCELNKNYNGTATSPMPSLNANGKVRGCESAAKILTLR